MSSEIKQRFVYVLTRTNKADDDETDVYVGSTSLSLRQRLQIHRCVSKSNNSKLYERMREVGINNWEIIPLLQRTCDKKTIWELERKWVKIMNADLNMRSPFLGFDFENKKEYSACYYKFNIQNKRYHCGICDLSFGKNKDLQKHFHTINHGYKYLNSVD